MLLSLSVLKRKLRSRRTSNGNKNHRVLPPGLDSMWVLWHLMWVELILQLLPWKRLTRFFSSSPSPISTKFVAPCYLQDLIKPWPAVKLVQIGHKLKKVLEREKQVGTQLMQRKSISATFSLPFPTGSGRLGRREHHHQVKGFCGTRGLLLFAGSINCSVRQQAASARMTSQPLSAPPSTQSAAAQRSAPKIMFIFQNWKMAQTTPEESMTTAWVQRGLTNWPSLPGTGNWNLTEGDCMEPDRTKAPETAAIDGQVPPTG